MFIVYIWFVFVVYCQRGSLFMYGDPLTPDFAAVGLGMFLSPLIFFLWRLSLSIFECLFMTLIQMLLVFLKWKHVILLHVGR